jgi:hypothetical protein
MIDQSARADQLIEEFNLCMKAKPRGNAIEVQMEKDACAKWAYHLNTQRSWGSELEIAEACNQLEPRLKQLREKVIIEILKHGAVY